MDLSFKVLEEERVIEVVISGIKAVITPDIYYHKPIILVQGRVSLLLKPEFESIPKTDAYWVTELGEKVFDGDYVVAPALAKALLIAEGAWEVLLKDSGYNSMHVHPDFMGDFPTCQPVP